MFEEELRRPPEDGPRGQRGTSPGPDVVPPLYEPLLVVMSPAAFSLAGFDRVDGADFAQS